MTPKLKVPLLGLAVAVLLISLLGCSKSTHDQIVMSVPPNFTGQVQIEMGVPGAPALHRDGHTYRVSIPPDGKVATSTMLADPEVKFENIESARVWGYSPSVSRTGDGFVVHSRIEFFVGTKEEYEQSEARKHKSKLDPGRRESISDPS
jgi:hypothetical protein